jgi:geranylgeranylglycerol-phosphate geranylgeranyltransferase
LTKYTGVEVKEENSDQKGLLRFFRLFYLLARSEWRVLIFTWALIVSYLIATDLKPVYSTLACLGVSGYFLTLGIYVMNALKDVEEDKINERTRRPIASGIVSQRDGTRILYFTLVIAFSLVIIVGITTLAIYVVALFLGVSYSLPRIRAKRIFSYKMIVSISGAAISSLTGGIAANSFGPAVFFAAVAFALFALVAMLIGDLADVGGDATRGIRSLPVVIGVKKSVWVTMIIPMIVGLLAIILFPVLRLNLIFGGLAIGLSSYSSFMIGTLLKGNSDSTACRKVKTRLRIIIPVLQLAFLIGMIAL